MFKNIKALLKLTSELNQSMSELKFEMVKTKDGEDINLSGREVGSEVTVGEGEAYKDGSVELEDGFKFTVKEGKIESIESEIEVKEDAPADTELADEEVVADAPAEGDKSKEFEDRLTAVEGQLKEILDALNVVKTDEDEFKKSVATKEDFNSLKTVFTSLNDAVKILAKMPAENSKVSETFKAKSQKEISQEALRNAWRK